MSCLWQEIEYVFWNGPHINRSYREEKANG
jgi:hypothetical protein